MMLHPLPWSHKVVPLHISTAAVIVTVVTAVVQPQPPYPLQKGPSEVVMDQIYDSSSPLLQATDSHMQEEIDVNPVGKKSYLQHGQSMDSLLQVRSVSDRLQLFPEKRYSQRLAGNTNTSKDYFTHHNHHRHAHATMPLWIQKHLTNSQMNDESKSSIDQIEKEIAAIFRDVAYRDKIKQTPSTRKMLSVNTGNRYERTTPLNKDLDYEYVADDSEYIFSGRRNKSTRSGYPMETSEKGMLSTGSLTNSSGHTTEVLATSDGQERSKSNIEETLKEQELDGDLYDFYDGHYADDTDDKSGVFRRGDTAIKETVPQQFVSKKRDYVSSPMNESTLSPAHVNKHKSVSQLSWFDVLLCNNRSLTWAIINFSLGLILVVVGILGPYRLLTLRFCTHLLPRTHFVAVHLLVFVATSFKAVYLFHLAFVGKDRIPLVLILVLTNSGFPCFSSALTVLIVMMFLTADVQVYKPKLLTLHNISVFIVMEIALCFIADVIVGCAHSKSVLVLSRLMLICVTVAVIIFYARKHQRVVQTSHLLKREFQGELKLLVVPEKNLSRERQMSIKHILRSRLFLWCQVMKITVSLMTALCFIHFCHSIFLVSSQVPAWAWWIFHVCGCLVEAVLAIFFYVAAFLTQRYNDKKSFLINFLFFHVFSSKTNSGSTKDRNSNAAYQKVSYSSGTESTQYTAIPNEVDIFEPLSQTPKAPRRRTATVRRSATFSHAPPPARYHRHRNGLRDIPPQVPRIGSASHIPTYSPRSTSHLSLYGPASVSHVPLCKPPSITSMLVHEDGFVRIRTPLDPYEASIYGYDPYNRLQDVSLKSHGSSVLISEPYTQEVESSLVRRGNLPYRRRNSRSSAIIHNNLDIRGGNCEPCNYGNRYSRQSYSQHPYNQNVDELDYQSLSRRRRRRRSSRESSLTQLNNIEKEAMDYQISSQSRNDPPRYNKQQMNDLDRSENNDQTGSRSKLFHDSNDTGLYYQEPDIRTPCQLSPGSRRVQRPRYSSVSMVDTQEGILYPQLHPKISNVSVPPLVHYYRRTPPGSPRREAHYPKPFIRQGSTSCLPTDEILHISHYPRANPVRRNHSSAGYFPSRNMTSYDMDESCHRYGSLRIGMAKKRHPGYMLSTNTSKILNKYLDKYPRNKPLTDYETEGGSVCTGKQSLPDHIGDPDPSVHSVNTSDRRDDEAEKAANVSGSHVSRSTTQSPDKVKDDADWALDVIKSSTILTDFYSLENAGDQEKETKGGEENGE